MITVPPELILLASASQSEAEHFKRELNLKVPTVFDSKKQLAKKLNAFWMGRAYLFAPDSRLVWLQKEAIPGYNPFSDKQFLSAIQGATQ